MVKQGRVPGSKKTWSLETVRGSLGWSPGYGRKAHLKLDWIADGSQFKKCLVGHEMTVESTLTAKETPRYCFSRCTTPKKNSLCKTHHVQFNAEHVLEKEETR